MASTEETIIEGLSLSQWAELTKTKKAQRAQKALNYLDGEQLDEMEKLLNDPSKGRKNWKTKGIIPRFRNVTKAIIEKSGRLFKDAPPALQVYDEEGTTELKEESLRIAQLMNRTEWVEVFTNLDMVVRLLKTALLLVQFNQEENRFTYEILHRGNTAVILKPDSRKVSALIYRTSDCDGEATYRIITETQYVDFIEKDNKQVLVGATPNPYGCVPVIEFYDTNIPRNGFWVDGGYDVVELNEMINLHYTDAEFAISWAKLAQLIMIDCAPSGEGADTWETVNVPGSAFSRSVPTSDAVITGGPNNPLQFSSNGSGTASVKFESPKIDISPMDTVVDGWVKAYAADWSVNVHTAGEGRAQSGFQLVVEELDNVTLRQQRQKMFEAGFKRLFNVIKKIQPGVFTEQSILFAEFPTPVLPVNSKDNENAWNMKIQAGRATVIDYFMEVKGLTEMEAYDKYLSIMKFQQADAALRAATGTEIDLTEKPVEATAVETPVDAELESNDTPKE